MGQTHVLLNLDKYEVVYPHGLGLGGKQVEHLGPFSGTLSDAMYLLTMTAPQQGGGDLPNTAMSGRWAGDRVVVYGEYSEAEKWIPQPESIDTVDITSQVREALSEAFESVTYTCDTYQGVNGAEVTMWSSHDDETTLREEWVAREVAKLNPDQFRVWSGLVAKGVNWHEAIGTAEDVLKANKVGNDS